MHGRKVPDPALERTQPLRPVAPGRVERRTHDDVRHGPTTLFAALEVATGRVTDACQPRHRHSEFLAFLRLVARAYPRRQLHVVVDNYATHKHAKVQAWLGKHPRVQLHFTPTYASWLNLVEVFFAIIERQALRRGDFASVEELMAAIRRFCDSLTNAVVPSPRPRTPIRSSPNSSVKHVSNGPLVVRLPKWFDVYLSRLLSASTAQAPCSFRSGIATPLSPVRACRDARPTSCRDRLRPG